MYIVELINDGIVTEIQGESIKLKSGTVVKGINCIDSFSFVILPVNIGYNKICDYKTLVRVYNSKHNRCEFYGRVLYSKNTMDSNGHITKDVVCESYFGFLCDSQQSYVEEQNWTVRGLLEHIINIHNSQVEDYKKFTIGTVEVEDANDNVYVGIQRENTWKTIEEKLVKKLGGEIGYRVENDINYIDYVKEFGSTKSTKIALSKNMKSITKENDPSEYITRLIPLGHKLSKEITTTDINGNETTQTVETEERLDISSLNDGKNYIDDEIAIATYGIRVGYVMYDDVTDVINLLAKGQQYLIDINKVHVKYSITALDLSLIGLEIDDFDIYNYHPIENILLNINDTARIIKKTINIIEETNSTIEVGDNFKTLSDIQVDQAKKVDIATNTIKKIESDYVTNERMVNETSQLNSIIQHSVENILLSVEENYTNKTTVEEIRATIQTELDVMADQILMNFTTTTDKITDVDGRLVSQFTEVYNYIKFAGGSITLGESGNIVTLTIENDAILFRKNGVTFSSWTGDNFYCGNIVIRVNERAQFGNYAYIPRSDGSLSFLKVGG